MLNVVDQILVKYCNMDSPGRIAPSIIKKSRFDAYGKPIDINMSKVQILTDPFMTPQEKAKAVQIFNTTDTLNGGTGTANSRDFTNTLLLTGGSMLAADFAGKVVGSLFGLPTKTVDVLRGTGVLYTGLKGLKII